MLNHSVKLPTINLSSPIAAPNPSNQCYKLTEFVLPGLSLPESRPAIAVTVSSVMLTSTSSGGRSSYESRLATVGARASRCLIRSTSITRSPVLLYRSPGCRTPPIYRSVIHLTSVCSFPRSTRIWYVCTRCSSESSLWATVRYSAHVRRVYSMSIPYCLSSQASRSFYICRRMAWDEVTCRACFSITVWKTMNRSEFHCLSRTPCISPPSVLAKRLPTFPLGTS